MTAHWGILDPAAVVGTHIELETAFVTAFKQMKNRISIFTSLPINKLDALSLKKELQSIGQLATQ
jgi:arsenate reductase